MYLQSGVLEGTELGGEIQGKQVGRHSETLGRNSKTNQHTEGILRKSRSAQRQNLESEGPWKQVMISLFIAEMTVAQIESGLCSNYFKDLDILLKCL